MNYRFANRIVASYVDEQTKLDVAEQINGVAKQLKTYLDIDFAWLDPMSIPCLVSNTELSTLAAAKLPSLLRALGFTRGHQQWFKGDLNIRINSGYLVIQKRSEASYG